VGDNIPPVLLAPIVFLVSAFIAFSVGSSWGTFAIMIPIAVPIAVTLGLPVPLMLAAAISGAIFGDHASPISDTTVLASMASATDHIDHVRTQLPYALVAAAIATTGFLVLGLVA
jgi:Na+/H+ antiporter NhaC